MAIVAQEVFWSSLLPGVVLVLLTLALQRVLADPVRTAAEGAALAVCFAGGQIRILGDFPWPPAETAHALVPLTFIAVVPRRRPEATWVAAYAVLNIGAYFALHPLLESALMTVVIQVSLAQVVLGVALSVTGQLPPSLVAAVTIIGLLGLGAVLIDAGSTSLAMTAWLLTSLTGGQAIISRMLRRPADYRTLQPAFAILLTMELMNFVL